ncbi:hypothetical protein ACNQT2_11590, partial [Corynebacterium diphtheriae]
MPDTPESPTGQTGTTCRARRRPPVRLAGTTCRTGQYQLLAMPELPGDGPESPASHGGTTS